MGFSVEIESFDFKVKEGDSMETLGEPEGMFTEFSLPIEGTMFLVITRDDDTTLEAEVDFNGQMFGHMLKAYDYHFFFPKVEFRCILQEEYPGGIEEIRASVPRILFGFDLEGWFSENSGMN